MKIRVLSSLLVCGFCLIGCSEAPSQNVTPESTVSQSRPEVPRPPVQQTPAGPRITRDSFELVASSAQSMKTGELGQVTVSLTSREGWHVNQEFPVAVEFAANSNIQFTKNRLDRSDATLFQENRFEFVVPATPLKSGSTDVNISVSFAVCTETNCAPFTENLLLNIPVM